MTSPTIPAAPILGHVEGVELVETGTWLAMNGPFNPTPDDLASAVAALDCPAVRRPILKAGHTGDHGQGSPALGYVSNMRLANEGHTLIGDFRGMPAWLTEPDELGDSVLASAYPDRSIEGEYDYRCQLGHTHPFVVHAVSWLGVERPAVGTLESLQELYGVVAATVASPTGTLVTADAAREHMPLEVSAAATTDDVRRAYYAGPGVEWDLWIREMYVDPPELIIDNDADGTILRVPYTVDGDGGVAFGEAQPVKVTYVNARAGGDGRLIVFASRAESRAVPKIPAANADGPSNEGGSAVAFSDEQLTTLRNRLGVADDASEDVILAALDEALAERADVSQDPAPAPAPLPEGTVVIDSEQLEELKVAAAAGREAREEQLRQERERRVDAAISDGRISRSRREHWLTQLSADPGSADVLASLAPGLVPMDPLGTSANPETSGDDAVYASLYPTAKAV